MTKQIIHIIKPESNETYEQLDTFLKEGYTVVQATPVLTAQFYAHYSAASKTSSIIYILKCPDTK